MWCHIGSLAPVVFCTMGEAVFSSDFQLRSYLSYQEGQNETLLSLGCIETGQNPEVTGGKSLEEKKSLAAI